MADVYLHNSKHKDYIRDKWVEFASDIIEEEGGLKVITFPAEELHDLRLFVERGLISWEQTETGAYYITKGKVVCFKKDSKVFAAISSLLCNATVEQYEIGAYLRDKYNTIMDGKSKIFPVDVVNLDYDGCIAKGDIPIYEIFKLVFEYQARHQKKFSLFVTWPQTEADDDDVYKNLLKKTIGDNLNDPRAVSFKEGFEATYQNAAELNYNQLSIIGLSKIIIQKATNHGYNLHKNEFYIYRENEQDHMFSILLNFDYEADTPEYALYANSVVKSLAEIKELGATATEPAA
ncbi:hypothetical protein ACCC92_03295 [Mucilaginibacter sp. Mucisp84]|uniref:hypothetical protein n=1 Tax=Mucilaginibacter sp. Mucisp84 TaxID=3243058 RepID=UPI0039A4292F